MFTSGVASLYRSQARVAVAIDGAGLDFRPSRTPSLQAPGGVSKDLTRMPCAGGTSVCGVVASLVEK